MSARTEDTTALLQSAKTTGLLMGAAVKIIDLKFGSEYAANNPQLVGLFVLSTLVDFHALELSGVLGSIADVQQGLAEALNYMAARSDNPAVSE